MKSLASVLAVLVVVLPLAGARSVHSIKRVDSAYNSITVERKGTLVELRFRARGAEHLESAVDLADPLKLVVAYTRSLYAFLLVKPEPKNLLMLGLGGAGFHRLFAEVFPDALLQTAELDKKVYELCQSEMDFVPTAKTPVEIIDGRMFVKRNKAQWDVIVLDAFRGDSVPAHLKTQEFYRECAARLSDDGVFVSNLHATTRLYYADLKTIQSVFPQLALFHTPGTGNVIAVAVKYREPRIDDPATWAEAAKLTERLLGRVDMAAIGAELTPIPTRQLEGVRILTDDFAPAEYLETIKLDRSGR